MKKNINLLLILVRIIFDAATVCFSFLLAYWVRFNISIVPVTKGVPPIDNYIRAMPIVAFIFLAAFKWNKLYEDHKIVYKTDEFLNIVRAVSVAVIITVAVTFIYREYSYSRIVIGYAYVFNVVFIYALHRIRRLIKIKLLVPFSGRMGILVIGGKKAKETLMKNISKHKEFDVYFIPEISIPAVKKLMSNKKIHEIVLADSGVEKKKVLKLINFCEETDIEFKMIPDMLELKMGEMSFDSYFGIPVLELRHPLLEPVNYYIKKIFDILISITVLVILVPLVIFTICIIKLDSAGPIIYYHLRKGYKGRSFKFYKFRSMVIDADSRLKDIVKYSERSGPVFKMKRDPRVTEIGRFIRRYSIDEIPQLYNVLKGDMSLVGPRPQVLWEAAVYDDEAKRRLNILPGITGLWQVSGRSELSFNEMIKLDLYYLENWTPGFDVKIILKTFPVVLLKKGAY